MNKSLVIKKQIKRNRINDGSRLATIIIYFIVGVCCFITLYPFYYVMIQSFADPKEVIAQTVFFWPKKYYLGSYELILKDPKMWRSYAYTLLYVLSGTFLNIVTSVCGAYPLTAKRLAFRSLAVKFVIIPMYFSGGLIPTFLLMMKLGLYNNVWAMILPSAVGIWNLILVRSYFMSLPEGLRESAHIDGAGHLRILTSIYIPLSKPILAVISIYTIVGIWNSWFNAMIYLPNSDLHPLQFYLYRVMIQQTVNLTDMTGGLLGMEAQVKRMLANYQLKYALIVFTTLPVIFAYPFFQKYFIKGVMLGSLKG
jgi:putative aldouronate transport system permease protein